MIIYLINIFFILLFAIPFLISDRTDKGKKIYCSIVALQWILLSGLRDWSVGADTYQYFATFEKIKYTSWRSILSDNWEYIFHGANVKDPGYMLFEKIFQIFSQDYQVFLICIAVIFTVPMAVWIYKNSSMPCLSFIIYSTLFYYFFAVTGQRQTLATALIVFVGYKYIKDKKFLKFAFIAFIAFMLHKSSLVFIPFYFLSHKRITKPYFAAMSFITLVIALLGKKLYGPVALFMGYSEEQVDYAGGGAETYALILTLVCVAVLVLYPWIRQNRIDADLLCNVTFLTLVSSLLVFQQQGFMRVQQYYSLFIMITIPEALLIIKKRDRSIVYAAGVIILVAHLISANPYYKFFFM